MAERLAEMEKRNAEKAALIYDVLDATDCDDALASAFPGAAPNDSGSACMNDADLAVLAEMMASGQVRPVIDRTYPLDDAAQALRYVKSGEALGKVVIRVADA